MGFDLEFKQQLIQKALNRGELNLEVFAKQHNVGYSTIQKWLKRYKEGKFPFLPNKTNVSGKNQQVSHVLACSNLDETAIGKYCRENSIYYEDLMRWREELMSQSDQTSKTKIYRDEIKALKAKNKELERELHRKERALA